MSRTSRQPSLSTSRSRTAWLRHLPWQTRGLSGSRGVLGVRRKNGEAGRLVEMEGGGAGRAHLSRRGLVTSLRCRRERRAGLSTSSYPDAPPRKVPSPPPWIPPPAVSSTLDHAAVRLLLTVSHTHDSPWLVPSTPCSTSSTGDGTGL
ncbi:hypothetical protein E2562_020335 [Oryza meyeriana var. granulata]|uniref:Uncharacterized protein n=1 Tax=Oryza meyeriana var. granulata TaxID=110450 RepID=A0A6G1E9T3_9ORYZ|nr:hypothetical protein E2562_020335 [Oryza meyeriana var. granulata]